MKLKFSTYIILLLVLLTGKAVFSQDYWVRQISPTTKWLYRCAFPDSLHGWAVGDSGVIVHTSNGGTNWDLQTSGIDGFIYDVFFVNKNLGWGIANGYNYFESVILKTTNSGLNWTYAYYPDSNIILNTICFTDSLHGFMGGYQGVILRTNDAGQTWARASVDSGFYYQFHIYKIVFYNSLIGYAAGGIMDHGGVIWRTTNGGFNWQSYSVSPEPEYDIFIVNSQFVYGSGGDYEFGANFVRSTDTGVLWEYMPLSIFGIGESVCFRTPYDIWIPCGFSQRWAHSTDTGNSFTEVMGTDSSAIYDAKFTDSLHGWAFGANGSILKFNYSAIGIKPISGNIPKQDYLSQNYPNPFNPSTEIEYNLSRTSHVKIELYDLLGKKVMTLHDNIEQAGNHIIEFNSTGLSSGVYFYKMITTNYTQTRKLVILK